MVPVDLEATLTLATELAREAGALALSMLFTCGGLGVWALVDGILLLVKNDWTDARGLYLRP